MTSSQHRYESLTGSTPSSSPHRRAQGRLRDDSPSGSITPPVHLSHPSSRQPSRNPSPLPNGHSAHSEASKPFFKKNGSTNNTDDEESQSEGGDYDNYNTADRFPDLEDPAAMPSDLRPAYGRQNDGKSYTPLLNTKTGERKQSYDSPMSPETPMKRRHSLRERDPEEEAKNATKKRYAYAGAFLLLALVSFVVQTETAHYIASYLGWKKSYAMLYFTHGSWSVLWFLQLLILRLQKWNTPWKVFWRRHTQLLHETALMVQYHDIQAPKKWNGKSPWPHILRTLAFVTCALTVAGGSWYVAVVMTTSSDLTAIYNCSAFFAYAFSIPMLKEHFRIGKASAVLVAVVGVLIVAYGDSTTPKHGSKSGGGAGGVDSEEEAEKPTRLLGNIVIAIGSILYGFYEVLYKKYACPPDGTSPGRSMIFANLFGSLIGGFTLTVLWIPIPILHFTGIETFVMPRGKVALWLAVSTLSNAIFSGSFLVLISLTNPVLSSVAALLTIFLVALVDVLLPPPLNSPLSPAALIGGCLIIAAFLLLSWSSYREMDEERRKKADVEIEESETEAED